MSLSHIHFKSSESVLFYKSVCFIGLFYAIVNGFKLINIANTHICASLVLTKRNTVQLTGRRESRLQKKKQSDYSNLHYNHRCTWLNHQNALTHTTQPELWLAQESSTAHSH